MQYCKVIDELINDIKGLTDDLVEYDTTNEIENKCIELKDYLIEKLWDDVFEDVLFVEAQDFYEDDEDYKGDTELVLNSDWRDFEAGTSREAIWHWFDSNHSKGLNYLFYGEE